ncbi:hypothetical protein AMS68_002780 [Peltaster fructicola]|uniref:Uncharacterized protein n=1 Tax=Peltaster fructicola TaxID=286661 RepID=A0A6H0XRD3_9PEZI|nr:hypothetical protein AMS68_002780 [Peltaster fructicola]
MAYQPQQFAGNYNYCDSYFVESHDDEDGIYARAAADRERHQQLSRLRQKALAQELSRATAEEYQEDVLDHMEAMEARTMPEIQNIEIQAEIQWFMRPYLLDFLLEAHQAFKLLPETFHLAVNLLDRYCSRRVVYKRHYQLVGCASLLIAAKYGDRKERVPTIRELKLMCCSLYEDDMFTQMEWHVLQTLDWIVGHPTVSSFAQLALNESSVDDELENMAAYFTEIALYHKEFISVRPSVMARSSLALARCVLGRAQPRFNDWASYYDPNVVLNLSKILTNPSPALVRKYSSPLLSVVAVTVEKFLHQQAMLAQVPAMNISYAEAVPQQPQYNATQYLAPSTPQKVGYQVPVGIITPPITPDKDMRAIHPYVHNIHVPGPSTPTPPPSMEQPIFYNQQQQYMMQPNYMG